MRQISFYYLFGVFLLVLLMIPISSQADIFMKQKNHTDGMQIMGQTQAAKDEIQTIWIAEEKIRSDSEEGSMILRLDQGKIYFIDHAKKTYSEMPMEMGMMMDEQIKKSMEEEGMGSEEQQAAMGMMQGMTQMKITITPTTEKKKIGNWNCQKYNQELVMMMGPMHGEIWATEDLKMDYDLYNKYMAAMMGKGGMFGDFMSQIVTEMKKINGVPVLTVSTMNMMGTSIKSTQELIEYKEGTAPAGHFNIPSGYKKTEMMWEQK
jgi:hypothetical protein